MGNLVVYGENGVYTRAAKTYGKEAQLRALQEECGELVAAINQNFRGRVPDSAVIEEIADVAILCTQMQHYYGAFEIEEAKMKKLTRLAQRLDSAPSASEEGGET